MKKKIFICSPYRGRVEENKKNAVSYARITAMSGDVPIVALQIQIGAYAEYN